MEINSRYGGVKELEANRFTIPASGSPILSVINHRAAIAGVKNTIFIDTDIIRRAKR